MSEEDQTTVSMAVRDILGISKDVIVYTPPGSDSAELALKASEEGALGIVDLELLDSDSIERIVKEADAGGKPFGVRVDPTSESLTSLISGSLPDKLVLLVSTPKESLPDMVRSGIYDTARSMGLKVFQEVCTVEEASSSVSAGVDAIILRGSEGGGRVSKLSTRDLLKGTMKEGIKVPLIVRPGTTVGSTEDLYHGISGVVLSSQLLGLPVSGLPDRVRMRIASGDLESIVLASEQNRDMRFLVDEKASSRIMKIEKELKEAGASGKEIYGSLKKETASMARDTLNGKGDLFAYPAGIGAGETVDSLASVVNAVALPSDEREPNREEQDSVPGKDEVRDAGKSQKTEKGRVTVAGEPVPPDYHDLSVAIVGIGSVFPKGIGNENYWKMIMDGVDACIEVPKDRWDWRYYYHPDRTKKDKAYSKIGAFITELEIDPFSFKIPPKVFEQIDLFQRYAMVACREALSDAGILDSKEIDRTRVGVVISNSGGGETRDWGSVRINMDFIHSWMERVEAFSKLPEEVRERIRKGLFDIMDSELIDINEDSMPGCLPNVASGRLANIFNIMGPNFITDAACASSLSAIYAARNSLLLGDMDIAISGGTDSMMTPQTFIEFCKIGALTPDGSRPFSDGANGFLMGEGSGVVILKRLEDAVNDGDKIYAVVRGIGGSSDGKGKGITAPNPKGQKLAVNNALEDARIDRSTLTFIEAHGTSTAVGDVAEYNSLIDVFKGLPEASIGLTSIKSQIGHLKAAAGAAGVIKAALSIKNRTIPAQINFIKPNHYMDWEKSPFYVITESMDWDRKASDIPRRCGVSAFGFGGTNFHLILEEFDRDIYDAWQEARKEVSAEKSYSGEGPKGSEEAEMVVDSEGLERYLKVHGEEEGEVFLFSSENPMELLKQAKETADKAKDIVSEGGRLRDAWKMPSYEGRYRLSIVARDPDHFQKQIETLTKIGFNEKALMALAAKGIFVGDRERVDHGKVCFMFPGQGSQYINMFRELRHKFKLVDDTFREADSVMADLIDEPLSSYVFVDVERGTPEFKEASETLRQTEFNQPSMLTVDTAMYKLLRRLGIKPDVVMGHSLGEYGALIASGIMDFGDALRAVSARGREMRDLKVEDPGKMASVMAGLDVVEEVLEQVDGYVIPANKNCHVQTVIAGASEPVDKAVELFKKRGIDTVIIPVSHAFHSEIVAPAKHILRGYLSKLRIDPPKLPILSNVTADLYPMEGDPAEIKETILDLLKEQMASPVEWIGQVQRAHSMGCRTFIEVGPKRALSSFAYNLLEDEVKSFRAFPVTSNHPKKGGIQTFNEMVGNLWALGFDLEVPSKSDEDFYGSDFISADGSIRRVTHEQSGQKDSGPGPSSDARSVERSYTSGMGGPTDGGPGKRGKDIDFRAFMENNREPIERFLRDIYGRLPDTPSGADTDEGRSEADLSGTGVTLPSRKGSRVVVSGVSFGLPGTFKDVFSEDNLDLLVQGRNLIENLDEDHLDRFIDKNIMRLDKKADGSAEMIKLDDRTKVAQLAGRLGHLDLEAEFGVPESLVDVLDTTSQLAFAAGILALKDAGIPLVKRYAQTSTGSFLPEEWELPLELQEDTGIVFASAYPGHDQYLQQLADYYAAKISELKGEERKRVYEMLKNKVRDTELEEELDAWYEETLKEPMEEYRLPRLLMFKTLAMGHSQFAQYIKAKGPNTVVNSACASSTLAISIAQDWIQAGRCKRVLVLGADNPSSDNNLEWMGSALLAMGALTNEKDVTKAALPFDRRRKGMIIGAGAAGLVVEAIEEPERRGMNPLVEIMGSHLGNSAFHGSRLDIAHIARSMDRFMTKVEKEWGMKREEIASDMVFMSHETYTPARGGSSAAEVESLRRTFGDLFKEILILNTKGYTGHAFGACIEDPVLIRCLERGLAIPLANLTPDQIDPQFEGMQLSGGGKHDRHYGLRLAAGFGSQLAFLLVKRPDVEGRFSSEDRYRAWLRSIATTEPVELEVVNNVLRLKDSGRDSLIHYRAVKRGSSRIGYKRNGAPEVETEVFEAYKDRVMDVFSKKTGFPREQIDIDADLKEDMGIDTVKQVELFAASRIYFDIPKDEGVNLRDYPTLRHVIYYIIDKTGGILSPEPTEEQVSASLEEEKEIEKEAPPEKADEEESVESSTEDDWESVKDKVIGFVSEKTGYPDDMLDLDLDLEADLGIDTVKQVELFGIASDEFDLPREEGINLQDLNTLRKLIDYIVEKRASGEGVADEGEEGAEEEDEKDTEPAVSQEEGPGKEEGPKHWDSIRDTIIKVVSEKTGYPEDMLELDLDLEADLGIDTVKQVELFAMASDEFGLEREEGINLGDFPTLRHIIDYVAEKTEGMEVVPADEGGREDTEKEGSVEDEGPFTEEKEEIAEERPGKGISPDNWEEVKEKVVTVVAEKTGYPEDMLELDLDLEADLGIDTVKQVELFAMASDEFGLEREEGINLGDFPTLRHIIDYVSQRTGDEGGEPVLAKIEESAVEEMKETDRTEKGSEVSEEEDEQGTSGDEPSSEDGPQAGEATSSEDWDRVKDKVIAVVAEKTGYPEDMLELDLDLEADLGIDTVKQVELFAMASDEFGLEREEGLNLSDFPTLRHIIDYVAGRVALTGEEKEEVREDAPEEDKVAEERGLTVDELKKRINRWVLEVGELDDLEAPDEPPLEGRKAIVIGGGDEGAKSVGEILGAEAVPVEPDQLLHDEVDMDGVEGIVNLYPLDMTDSPLPEEWSELNSHAVKALFKAVKALDAVLKKGGFFISVTAMGGRFGLDTDINPINGGVSGFTKAAGREYSKCRALVFDVPHGTDIETVLKKIAAQLASEEDLLEVGWDGEKRTRPLLRIIEPPAPKLLDLEDGMKIMVTGGGTGITAEIVKEMAGKASLELHLLGRTRIKDDVDRLAALDEKGLEEEKNLLIEQLRSTGKKVTPVMVDREFSKVTKSVSIHRLLNTVEENGSRAVYHSLDVKDEEGLARIVEENGPFHGVVHAAGIEQSKLVCNKKMEDFDRVYDTKVMGAHALLLATKDQPLKFFISFSSVAGRFGNGGQVDYSAANDLLDKMHGTVRRLHPLCHVKAVGWSAWADVGMASRGSVKTLLELGGITFIPVESGVRFAIDEVTSGKEYEVFYSGSMGPMDTEGQMLWDEGICSPGPIEGDVSEGPPEDQGSDTGEEGTEREEPERAAGEEEGPGSDKAHTKKESDQTKEGPREEKLEVENRDEKKAKGPAPLFDEELGTKEGEILLKRTLDGERERFLPDHTIMKKMVLPGVMGMEMFAEAASVLEPKLDVVGLEDVRFMKPVNVEGPTEVYVKGKLTEKGKVSKDGEGQVVIDMTFFSKRSAKRGDEELVHYSGKALLGKRDEKLKEVQGHPVRPGNVMAQVGKGEIYDHLFHTGTFRIMEGMEVLKDGELLGIYHPPDGDLFETSTGWKNDDLITVPMQTELGFQTAGAYVMDRFKLMALPTRVGSIVYHGDMKPSKGALAWVRFQGREDNTFRFDVDLLDEDNRIVVSYTDYELRSLMAYKKELKGDHSVPFEEVESPTEAIRTFRLDMEAVDEDLEPYIGYFDEEEWKAMAREKMTQKRRREHTLGRVISKLGISWYLATEKHRVVPVKDIRIKEEENGKPFGDVDGERIEISISHSHRWAVSSVGDIPHGVDIELSEPRDPSFADEAFTGEETGLLKRIQSSMELDEYLSQTLLFSSKEAYLKKTGKGMSVNLRKVQCTEALKLPSKNGLLIEVLISHEQEEARVRASIASAYVLSLCA